MALNIVPYTYPLYNMHKACNVIYEKYGDDAFLSNMLLENDNESEIDYANTGFLKKFRDALALKNVQRGANKEELQNLSVSVMDQFISLFNLRISSNKTYKSNNTLNKFYFILSVTVLSIIVFYVLFIIRKKNKLLNIDQTDKYCLYASIIVAFVFILVIMIIIFRRKKESLRVQYKTIFTDLQHLKIHSLYAFVLNRDFVVNEKRFLRYSIDPKAKGRGKYIDIETLFFEHIVGMKKDKGFTTSEKAQLAVVIFMAMAKKKIPINESKYEARFNEAVLMNIGDLKFPGFDSNCGIPQFYQSIVQLDIVEQVSRLSVSISYFKDFLSQNEVFGADNSTLRADIYDSIKNLFNKSHFTLDTLVPITTNGWTSVNNIDEGACFAKCLNDDNSKIAVYNNKNNTCYISNNANEKFWYGKSKNDAKNPNVTFVKDNTRILISNFNSNITDGYIDADQSLTNVSFSTLSNNYICKVTNQNCDNIAHKFNAPIDSYFKNTFSKTFYESPPQTIDGAVLSIQPSVLSVQNNPDVSIIADTYINSIITTILTADPNGNFSFTAVEIDALSNSFAKMYANNYITARNTMIDKLNEVPLKLKMRIKKNEEESDVSKTIFKYATEQQLLMKLNNMTHSSFVNVFCKHAHNVMSCSHGLQYLSKKYVTDNGYDVIANGYLIRSLFACMILVSGFFLAVLACRKIHRKNKKTGSNNSFIGTIDFLNKASLQSLIKYTIVWSILIMASTVSYVNAFRYKEIHTFNYETMIKNADILVDNSYEVYNYVIREVSFSSIFQGKKIPPALATKINASLGSSIELIYIADTIKKYNYTFDEKEFINPKYFNINKLKLSLENMVESFDKCNMLLFGNNVDIPFPSYEISIYLVTIVLIVIFIVFLVLYIEPLKKLREIKRFKKILSNYKYKNLIASELKAPDLNNTESIRDISDIFKYFILLVGIIAFVFLFSAELFRSSNVLLSSLYGSSLYRENICYDL